MPLCQASSIDEVYTSSRNRENPSLTDEELSYWSFLEMRLDRCISLKFWTVVGDDPTL